MPNSNHVERICRCWYFLWQVRTDKTAKLYFCLRLVDKKSNHDLFTIEILPETLYAEITILDPPQLAEPENRFIVGATLVVSREILNNSRVEEMVKDNLQRIASKALNLIYYRCKEGIMDSLK